ncbi:MAG: hypothetical protein IJW76_03820 [Clostridia bacterium]|nr:hypothetical protein [Clostridia bacterium]
MLKKIISLMTFLALLVSTVSCGYVGKEDLTTGWSHPNNPSQEGYSATYAYQTFEEYCTSNFVTDVIIGTLVNFGEFGNDHVRYTFQVNEAILGNANGMIDVIVPKLQGNVPEYTKEKLRFDESYIPAGIGIEYLLPLRKTVDLYSTPNIYYTWSYATAIILDDVPSSEMYNDLLYSHATGIDIKTCTREEIIEYVRELTKNNQTSEEELSTAQSLKEIVKDASAVYHIKTWYLAKEVEGDLKHTEIWDCEILEALKGELPPEPEDPEDPGLVWIIFFPDTVEEGKEYIVAVDGIDGSQTFFELVTKDGLRPVSEKSQIKSYID